MAASPRTRIFLATPLTKSRHLAEVLAPQTPVESSPEEEGAGVRLILKDLRELL